MHPIYSLIASLVALAFGPLALWLGPKDLHRSRLVNIILVGVVLVFIGLEVGNHADHIDFGRFAIIFVVSLIATQAIEQYLTDKMDGAGDKPQTFTLVAIVIGMAAHAIMDGVVLRESVFFLPMAIILHRLPASLLIWQVVARRGRRLLAAGLLTMIGIGTIIGYSFASTLLPSHDYFQYVQAVVAGALLHVAFHHHPHDPSEDESAASQHPATEAGRTSKTTYQE